MTRDPAIARTVWRRLEPIHAVTYFASEAVGAFADAGYKGFWMGYFAGRAAPLGPVGPPLVGALFYNFAPSRIQRALPDAWAIAGPDIALAARSAGAVAALRRCLGELGDTPAVARAAELAARAAGSAPGAGHALFAANADLDWPDEPLAALWHAATLLRAPWRRPRRRAHVARPWWPRVERVPVGGRQRAAVDDGAGARLRRG